MTRMSCTDGYYLHHYLKAHNVFVSSTLKLRGDGESLYLSTPLLYPATHTSDRRTPSRTSISRLIARSPRRLWRRDVSRLYTASMLPSTLQPSTLYPLPSTHPTLRAIPPTCYITRHHIFTPQLSSFAIASRGLLGGTRSPSRCILYNCTDTYSVQNGFYVRLNYP